MVHLIGFPVSGRRKRRGAISCFAALAIATVLATASAPSRAQAADPSMPTGPAAQAVLHWFKTDHSLACYNFCNVADNEAGFAVYYGDSTGAGPKADALVFITYLVSPPGNLVGGAVGYFHREGGAYHFVSDFPRAQGLGLVSGTTVQFLSGKAKFSLVVRRATDPLCCATGRASYTVTLNPASNAGR
jgi:hypothetical protein